MCISCGCGKYEDSHGDERNVTVATLERSADASNLTIEQVVKNMAKASSKLQKGPIPDHMSRGQAVKERIRPD
jgi:hypothetical protein